LSAVLSIPTARVFAPLLKPSRYKGSYGGRGSGKSHFFAEKLVDDSMYQKGLRSVCIREVQKSLKESAKRLIEDKLTGLRLGERHGFKLFKDVIQTPGDGIVLFQGMQDHTAESIKSIEGFHRAWVEEAQTLSARSLQMLRPTIRGEDSELWFSWNPRRKNDPVDVMLRQGELPTDAVVVRANWNDNPWFPSVLEQERQDCLRTAPDQYGHIWEGDYVSVAAGAYYAKHIAEARLQHRIGRVSPDPLLTIRLFFDIGGTGARADAASIWAAQFVGQEIRVLQYYEAQGQPLATHVAWLRAQGYTPERAQIWLPHDGATNDRVYDVSYESALRAAGYKVTVVPNQGKGAAAARIEEGRRLFPQMWFDEEGCRAGLEALGWYHERIDESRNIGLGPEHDWSSHGADAFGLMCVVHEVPGRIDTKAMEVKYSQLGGGWMV
jgi:phage terminase large subunit